MSKVIFTLQGFTFCLARKKQPKKMLRLERQQVLNVVPEPGSLKSAGKRQESATFQQRSFFNVAVQFLACCSAAFGTK